MIVRTSVGPEKDESLWKPYKRLFDDNNKTDKQ